MTWFMVKIEIVRQNNAKVTCCIDYMVDFEHV